MIDTPRLILRRWHDGDIAPFHAMGQDAEVMRFIGAPMTLSDCEAAATRQNAFADTTGRCFWAIERRADGAFIGFCGIKPGPEGTPIAGQPEIGWRFARAAWGQGYALEAAQANIVSAFADASVNHIVAITVHANTRSWGLMERLGMQRVDGGDFDHPAVPDGSPLKRHLTYRLTRAA